MKLESADFRVISSSRRLSIPIYLNQRIVFDLLAIVREGFSQLRTIRTSDTESQTNRSDLGGQLGASNVFAFWASDSKDPEGRNSKASQNQQEVAEERVFTPTSLFSALRDGLIETRVVIRSQFVVVI